MWNFHPKPIQKYDFFNRSMPYGQEQLEISPEEMKQIKNVKPTPVQLLKCKQQEGLIKVIIDTDIGTDVDDAMALLYALQLPNLQLLGVTTNYGPSELRASLAQKIVDNYQSYKPDSKAIPVIAGASLQLGTHRPVFIAGNEGMPFISSDQAFEKMNTDMWAKQDQTKAADFIAQQVNLYPNQVKIISIGIPTNIALAIQRNKKIASKIDEIIFMGGGTFMSTSNYNEFRQFSRKSRDWDKNLTISAPFGIPEKENVTQWVCDGNVVHLFPNHNFSGDSMATKYIFDQPNIKIKVIPHNITAQFWLKGPSIAFLRHQSEQQCETQNPFVTVGHMVEKWMQLRSQNGQCPHDPLTIHETVFGGENSVVKYVKGKLIVHEWAAFSTFVPSENGNHCVGLAVENPDVFMNKLEKLLMNGEILK
ncbi:inosine-uridine_preferring nucleoside hydrolase [Hexamita inflata]|uniref:Putative n=1 Tax=Hexamita inflata TaxID=28002 RepID=A0AA86PKW1_9EUKA|nr:inosine-uridine preferring nucleoside hydrolase [Hexamita inflata]